MTEPLPRPVRSYASHRLAMATLGSAAALVFVGGLVTTYKAGLAVPDWPTTFGYSMITYPLTRWLYGPWQVFIEHGHRLLGLWVGCLTLALAVVAWVKDPRPGVRRLALAAVVLVVFQGTLGGLRVVFRSQALALVHGCVAPVFLALLAALCVITDPKSSAVSAPASWSVKLRNVSTVLTGLIYLQIVLGALLRPFPYYASWRQFSAVLMFHLGVALLVAAHVGWLAWLLWGSAGWLRPLRRLTWLLAALVAVQLVLGPTTWVQKYAYPGFLATSAWAQAHLSIAYSGPQVLVTTGHVLVGSLLLVAATMLCVKAWRLQPCSQAALCEQAAREADSAAAWKLSLEVV